MNPLKNYSSIYVNRGEKIKKEKNKKQIFSKVELTQKLLKFKTKLTNEN